MFSQTNEYALRVIAHLAAQDGAAQTTRQIAVATKVPEGYLSKVLQTLGKAELVHSQRGLHGGFTLAKDPAELSVFDVIQAVDPLPRVKGCPIGMNHGAKLCSLHKHVDAAFAEVERAFQKAKIADILADNTSAKPLSGERVSVSVSGKKSK